MLEHLEDLKKQLTELLDIAGVIEPSVATCTNYFCLLPGIVELQPLSQGTRQTDVPYDARVKIVFSWRLEGGNENLNLTKKALCRAIHVAEFFHADNDITTHCSSPFMVDDELELSEHGRVIEAKKQSGDFARIGDDNKLFLYREDWELWLCVRVLRHHTSSTLQQVTYERGNSADMVVK
ncbi:hypothetical protein [Pseudoalteromonas luteoviolacea]|uniref:hypothetical protein n=1 Tax=Pseudoalteromonas luteoviolacea TaxID=43657 RepID=UPI0011548931|nr:hypothetical protein [Pseudoalteromonas luteoviolacea]TQF71778.1 hypothetical protein FLM44_12145 [Pseudoalteromonas luteoviolacea]